jgi:plasmid maintenance system killer protein
LESNYKKAKEMILSGHPENVDFKKRQPYKSEKYYFRLNKQYRAICFFDDEYNICVYEIDNHSY